MCGSENQARRQVDLVPVVFPLYGGFGCTMIARKGGLMGGDIRSMELTQRRGFEYKMFRPVCSDTGFAALSNVPGACGAMTRLSLDTPMKAISSLLEVFDTKCFYL